MVRNRDLVNRNITSLEGKLEAIHRHVERQWPVEDYLKLLDESKSALKVIQNNLGISRNGDILVREMRTIEKSLDYLIRFAQGKAPIEEYYTLIKRAVQSLEALDQAIQREPLEGQEISNPKK